MAPAPREVFVPPSGGGGRIASYNIAMGGWGSRCERFLVACRPAWALAQCMLLTLASFWGACSQVLASANRPLTEHAAARREQRGRKRCVWVWGTCWYGVRAAATPV